MSPFIAVLIACATGDLPARSKNDPANSAALEAATSAPAVAAASVAAMPPMDGPMPMGSGHQMANHEMMNHASQDHPTSGVADASTVADSSVDAAVTPASTIYTCVMHPEIQRSGPGVCPKCGMTLVRKTTK